MSNQDQQKTNLQLQKDWIEKIKDLTENAPEGVRFTIIAQADVNEDHRASVIGAGGKVHDVLALISRAMDEADDIKNLLQTAVIFNRVPSYPPFNILRKSF